MESSQQFSSFVGDWFNGLGEASLLGLVLSVVGMGLLLYAFKTRRSAVLDAPRPPSSEEIIASLEKKIELQNSAMSLLGERVSALEEYLEMIGSRQQRQDADKKDMRFYQQAISMADKGLSAEELAQRCGISASEADLITMLYQKTH
ncbi:MAG: DUF2802 domain-containing protein [Zhongshania sp.]|uniref:DUF2802 domain-containing protein n=1 Tax=Zhongshania sp. TaxID=1971902 RepID=UPI00261141C3|nr:DUF2802 domain-containing protein [Zhongshania sp.]MDF1693881.1 DUF2802 domain-containing protein [Zhongshania sp.]